MKPILTCNTIAKVTDSYTKKTPLASSNHDLENEMLNHYSNFCHSIKEINDQHEIRYSKVNNLASLILLDKNSRVSNIPKIFPEQNQEQQQTISLIVSTTNKRFDRITFSQCTEYLQIPNTSQVNNYEVLKKINQTAEALKSIKIQTHEVWPILQSKFISCFTKVDLNFITVLISGCSIFHLESVVAFSSQYYMLKVLGLQASVQLLYLFNEEGNMTYLLNTIKANITSYSVPSNFFSSSYNFIQNNMNNIDIRSVAFNLASFGLYKVCLSFGCGAAFTYVASPLLKYFFKPALMSVPKPVLQIEDKSSLISEPKVHPYAFSGESEESKIAKEHVEGFIGSISTASYYATQLMMAPIKGASAAESESLSVMASNIANSAGKAYKNIKRSFKHDDDVDKD